MHIHKLWEDQNPPHYQHQYTKPTTFFDHGKHYHKEYLFTKICNIFGLVINVLVLNSIPSHACLKILLVGPGNLQNLVHQCHLYE